MLRFGRKDNEKDLKKCLKKADFVYHLAGINRPKSELDFTKGNLLFTEKILAYLEKMGKKTPLLMTSSIQAKLKNPYGISKKAAEDAIFNWSRRTGANVYVYRLPNVFGKWCKPNYNSVVATFCYNIANNLDIQINDPEAELTLVYIDDVVSDFIKRMKGEKKALSKSYCRIPRDFKISLAELADKVNSYKNSRQSLIMPNFENIFDKFLYATYTSYLDSKDFAYNLDMKKDERGWLAEFIKSTQFGQIFISRTHPGVTRGRHWHHTKIEKFLVVDGEAEINFRQLDSKDKISYKVRGKELKVVDIPAGYTHSITNIGRGDLITLFWADEIFNPKDPDTHYLEV